MKKTMLAVLVAASVVGAGLASTDVQAQSLRGHMGSVEQQDPAKRVPAPVPAAPQVSQPAPQVQQQAAPVDSYSTAPAQSVQSPSPEASEAPASRGAFFVGVQGGKGWVYDDIDQSARMVNAGYRWQAGPVTQVGIEVARGELASTTDGGFHVDKITYTSIGPNARFNFGNSPVHALVRGGYWRASSAAAIDNEDGGYIGAGLGVDIGHNFSLSLQYTHHIYFDDQEYYYWGSSYYESINRADTLMFGAEIRF